MIRFVDVVACRALLGVVLLWCSVTAVAEPFMFVPVSAYNQVAVINLPTELEVARVSVGVTPRGLAVSQSTDRAYTANWGNNTVSVIDTVNFTVIATITVQNNPNAVVVSRDGTRVYVTNLSSNSVSVIDAGTNTVIATWSVPDSPIDLALTPDGSRLVVSRGGAPLLHVFNTATGAVVGQPVTCNYGNFLAMHPDGKRVFASCYQANRVVSIDTQTLTKVDDFAVSDWPAGMSFSPDGQRLYVVRRDASRLDTLALPSGQVLGSVSVTSGSFSRSSAVAISPDGSRAFTTELYGPHVSVVNTATQVQTKQLQIGNGFVGPEMFAYGVLIGGRGALTPPVIGVATAGDQSVSVQFAPPMYLGSSPITSYRATCGSQIATGTASPINVTGLTNGVPVRCTVRASTALANSGESAQSNEVTPNAPPPPPTVPPAPVLLSVTPAPNQAQVAFEPITGIIDPVIEYQANCPPALHVPTGQTSPLTVLSLSNGVTYSCRVRARNINGWGDYSNLLTVVPADRPFPPVPLSAVGGIGAITLNFLPPTSNNGSAVLDYEATCGAIVVTNTASPIVVTGLQNGITHTCTLRARNAVGYSNPSTALSALVGKVPGAPTITAVTPAPSSLLVDFSAPTSDGGLPITRYVVTCGSQTADGTANSLLVSGLGNGIAVNCTVRAENALGLGPSSNQVVGTPRDVPNAPGIVLVEVFSQQLYITLSAPANNGAPIQEYVARCDNGLVVYTGSPQPEVNMTGLANGQTYTCTVEAINAAGASAPSAPFVGTPAGPPSPPTLQSLQAGDGSLTFKFLPPANNNGGPILQYQFVCVRVTLGDTVFTTVPNQASPFTYTGLLPREPHECWIHAQNVGGSSARSNRLTAVPLTNPGAPVLTSVQPQAGGANLVFNPPADDGGGDIVSYEASCDPGPLTAIGAASPILVPGLFDNHTYVCRVRASNAVLTGPYSEPIAVIPGTQGSTANLSITKSNGVGFINDAEFVNYEIVVSNPGPNAVVGALVSDPLGTDFQSAIWQCSPQGFARCVSNGTGELQQRVDLPVGSSVTYQFSALPIFGPSIPISNVASVTPPVGVTDPNLANNVASDGPDIRGIFKDGFEN